MPIINCTVESVPDRSENLGQHRTIPALRLKHRSGSCRTSLAVSALRIMRYCLREHSFLFCHHAPKRQKGCRTALQMSRTGDTL